MIPAQSMRIANAAAGIVVAKAGTAVVTFAELTAAMSALDDHDDVVPGRLVSWDEARGISDGWKARGGGGVGFNNGCFDLIHPGHIALLTGAADFSDRLILTLNTDRCVSRPKGSTRPIQDNRSKARVAGAVRGVNLVALFDEETPRGTQAGGSCQGRGL